MELLKNSLILLIKFYRKFVSPALTTYFGVNCRYYPTCSEYALCAIKEWGVLKGTYLSLMRFLRCNPFFSGGYDPPPVREITRSGLKER